MACKLATSPDGTAGDFTGNVGDVVKIAVDSDSGGAFITGAAYAGAAIPKPSSGPWKFTIVSGQKFLTIVVEDPTPREWTRIQEVCDDGTKSLLYGPYRYDPYGPTQTLEIQGS